jgi:uncharacterized UPF0160 family protein
LGIEVPATIRYLVTHSGGFHADELLSSVLLTRLFPDAQVIRSRDPAWISPSPDRIIYDVGGQFDAELQIFDHHQRAAPLRPDAQPYSSFGLIWRQYGALYLEDLGVSATQIDVVHTQFDKDFVLLIDLLDNGALSPSVAGPLAHLTLPELLESQGPVFDNRTPTIEDEAFAKALDMARLIIEAFIAKFRAGLRAEAIVAKAILDAGSSPILELPYNMPFLQEVLKSEADHLLFVITPRGTEWTLGGIRLAAGGFKLRADLPTAWAGLTGSELEEASGVKDALFCHTGRFIAAAKNYDAICKMAEISVHRAQKKKTLTSR